MSDIKMPHRMKKVHQMILEHPDYKDLKESTRFCFEMGCYGGFSYCTKENNAWSRKIWKYLYWNEVSDEGDPL